MLMGAHAFTLGHDVVLGSHDGLTRAQVLDHELRHVEQVDNYQRGAGKASSAALEAEAESAGPPRLGADPTQIHGLWWIVPLLVGGYILLDPDPANAPGPSDPVYPAKNPAQRVGESLLFAAPPARLAAGGAGIRAMMMWGGGSAVGMQGLEDLGRGELSSWNQYAGRGASGAIGWGLPAGPMRAFSSGTRGLPLFRNFAGYGTATGLGLRGAEDLRQWQLSPAEDYLLWGAAGFGAGLLGATVVTGLDFVATMVVGRSNVAISRSIAADQSMTIEGLQQLFARRPDLAGRLGQSYLQSRSLAAPGNLVARQGTVNVGGGHETPQFSNLNPFMAGTGGPTGGVQNHVLASFEQIEQVFQPGSVQSIMSSRLPASTVNWPAAAQGAHRVMAPGGSLQINVWSRTAAETEQILQALRDAGFSNVRLGGSFSVGTRTIAVESEATGSGVIISAVR